MSTRRQALGRLGEDLAVEYLTAAGYKVLERNWRCPAGEIDIVAQEGDCLVVVEVRARSSDAYGTPEESVTPAKQAVLIACGQYLVLRRSWDGPWRIDLAAVRLSGGRAPDIRLLRNAVQG
jgi:putative endonuclease